MAMLELDRLTWPEVEAIGDPARSSAEHGARYWERAVEITLGALGEPQRSD